MNEQDDDFDLDEIEEAFGADDITDNLEANQEFDHLDESLAEIEALIDREEWEAARAGLGDLAEKNTKLTRRVDMGLWTGGQILRWNLRLQILDRWTKQVAARLDWRAYFARGAA